MFVYEFLAQPPLLAQVIRIPDASFLVMTFDPKCTTGALSITDGEGNILISGAYPSSQRYLLIPGEMAKLKWTPPPASPPQPTAQQTSSSSSAATNPSAAITPTTTTTTLGATVEKPWGYSLKVVGYSSDRVCAKLEIVQTAHPYVTGTSTPVATVEDSLWTQVGFLLLLIDTMHPSYGIFGSNELHV